MPLTHEIPEEAMPVVEVLRRDVPRPKEFPKRVYHAPHLCWNAAPKLWSRLLYCCPMGLHPRSAFNAPGSGEYFAGGETTNEAVEAFGEWWDEQTDPAAAVNAIWPNEEGE